MTPLRTGVESLSDIKCDLQVCGYRCQKHFPGFNLFLSHTHTHAHSLSLSEEDVHTLTPSPAGVYFPFLRHLKVTDIDTHSLAVSISWQSEE